MQLNIEAKEFIRDFVYSMRDCCGEFPEGKRVELTRGIEKICESLLMEAERQLDMRRVRETHSENHEAYVAFNNGITDCKQVLRNMIEK